MKVELSNHARRRCLQHKLCESFIEKEIKRFPSSKPPKRVSIGDGSSVVYSDNLDKTRKIITVVSLDKIIDTFFNSKREYIKTE